MNINWYACQPTPYNDFLFKTYSKTIGCNLHVRYRRKVLDSHPWKTQLGEGYKCSYYNELFSIDFYSIKKSLISKSNEKYVIAGWDHPTVILLLIILNLRNQKYILWTDTPDLAKKRNIIKAVFRTIFLRWIFSGASALLATGNPGASALKKMGAHPKKIYQFPFWVDNKKFENARNYSVKPRTILRLISSGRLVNSMKGFDLSIKSVADVLKSSNVPWQYIIAGTGPDQSILEDMAKYYGVQDNVIFMGWVEPDELVKLMASSHMMIHPSPIHDPYPNAILEGMAAGCVVLASDCCGSAQDRIINGFNGMIHKAGDINQLNEQLAFLVKNHEQLVNLSSNAVATANKWDISLGTSLLDRILEISENYNDH